MDVSKNNNKSIETKRHTETKDIQLKTLEERMNKPYWIIAFTGTLIIYTMGFAANSTLWVHIAFALSLALALVTLSEVK